MLRQRLKILVACVLTVLSAAGAIRAVKASSVSYLYRKTRYGLFEYSVWEKRQVTNPDKVIRLARVAEDHYPEHYHFFAHAASISWDGACEARDKLNFTDFDRHLKQALHFSQKAVALNPYGEQTRRVYADVLVEAGRTTEAIDYWREYVLGREYWKGINHDKMAYLLMRSDDPEHLREAVTQMTPPPNQNIWLVQDPAIRAKLRALQKIILK